MPRLEVQAYIPNTKNQPRSYVLIPLSESFTFTLADHEFIVSKLQEESEDDACDSYDSFLAHTEVIIRTIVSTITTISQVQGLSGMLIIACLQAGKLFDVTLEDMEFYLDDAKPSHMSNAVNLQFLLKLRDEIYEDFE